MPVIDCVAELTSLLEQWDQDNRSAGGATAGTTVINILARMAELVEKETEAWYKMDPDPFDDRHPGRADPNCALGHLLKALFKNETFMIKLVSEYLLGNRDHTDLHTVSCRLLLDIMPGLETTIVFQENDSLVRRLTHWAEFAENPLRSYATGLLAGAMEIQDIAANFKDKNTVLVPLMLCRLHDLRKQGQKESASKLQRPFADIGKTEKITISNGPKTRSATLDTGPSQCTSPSTSPTKNKTNVHKNESPQLSQNSVGEHGKSDIRITTESSGKRQISLSPSTDSPPKKKVHVHSDINKSADPKIEKSHLSYTASQVQMAHKIHNDQPTTAFKTLISPKRESNFGDCSNSSWAEMEPYVIGSYCMYPLGPNMEQRLIMQYLTPMGVYQEMVSHVFEHNALDLIFYYIDLSENRDVRLAFEALKYLAALLCHKKVAIEFIQEGGVQKLLEVYRPSVAATGVSMCLYYLAYFEDAMERVCLLPNSVLADLVRYVLWLLECSHESGRCHATMFFSMAFPFRIILELCDYQDGLRKLFNVISTLAIVNVDDTGLYLTEDEVFTSRQAARHVCVALKKYMEAHLGIKADQMRRSHLRNEGGSPLAEIPAYKATKFTTEVVQDNIELLLECLPHRLQWEPIVAFNNLGGITLLLQLLAMAAEWSAYTGKAETIKCALDVLAVCSVMPQTQLKLCDSVALPDNVATPSVSILLGLAEVEVLLDADVQRAALNVVINCVSGPLARFTSGSVGRFLGGSARRKVSLKNGEDLLAKMWNSVRSNNGIMVLLKLLMIKVPITEADSLRALACKALVGLARCDTMKQIVSKLPLFNNGQLQALMKEPVLQDMRIEHNKFCKYANELIERVSGKPQNANIDASLDRIRKADVVAQTKIVYQEKELLQLIHEHLLAKGLNDAANTLQKEAELPRSASTIHQHPSTPSIYSTPTNTPRLARQFSTPASLSGSGRSSVSSTPHGTPIRINILTNKTHSPIIGGASRMQQTRRIIRQKHEATAGSFQSPVMKTNAILKKDNAVSLDKIVTEYLRKQHALCKNPVITCPPFSLLSPHRCPDPMHRGLAPTCITSRITRRSYTPRYGGQDGLKFDRKYIYSRFRPIRSYRDGEEEGCFSCCAFSAYDQYLMLGTYAGELKFFNIQTAEEMNAYECHHSFLTHCEPSRDGKLVLTSSSRGRPLSALWNTCEVFEMKHSFDEDSYVEFSHWTQDRMIGTKEDKAHVYDVATGRRISLLFHQDKANNYTGNRATFNPTDDLVLNDGVLWDVNSSKVVHKFDKFNPNISGVFHPMGQEIIINSEVWDLRTFRLLHTVPALDQCQIRFNHRGDIIYGAIHQLDEDDPLEDETIKSPFGSSFRTFDATDYSNIATIDVKKNIFDMCTDSSDCYIAVIENQRSPETLREESLCRIYEVGRRRDEEDDAGEDDEEEEEEDEDGLDDDDDDEDDDDDIDDIDIGDEPENGNDNDDNADDSNSDDNSNSSDDSDSDAEIIQIIGSDDEGDDDDDEDMEDVYFQLSTRF